MYDHSAPFDLAPDPARLRDEEGDGSILMATARFLGVEHHLILIRVEDDGLQRAADEANESDYDAIQRLHEGRFIQELHEGRLRSVEVPGRPGRYVAYMHPFGA